MNQKLFFCIANHKLAVVGLHSPLTPKGFYKKKLKIGDGYRISASSNHLVFAYYVTGHGFGHATRVVERCDCVVQVARHLVSAGHDVRVVTAAPEFVLLDCGAVQADALTVDRIASLEKVLAEYSQIAVTPRASILATEVKWLNSINADLVVSDVVPVACRAAADAGIPSVCVTNFSACFRDVIDVPLIVRGLRKFRNEPAGWKLKKEFLPDGWLCLCYQGGVEMPIKDMFSGYWTPHLQNAINLKPSYEGGTNGGEVVARVIQDIAIAKSYAPTKAILTFTSVIDTAFFGAFLLLRLLFYGALATQDRPQFPMHRQAA
ncbi:hypothetical protein Syun_024734 [Stephania yunnanensis]|uniref:L-arabinokinase n=1 Tax=Stephania yunnanensis TaxID=152371 RepID=A0AAP0EZ56_9MAGN